jgi:hypothetical protein
MYQGEITNSYSRSDVQASDRAGGLAYVIGNPPDNSGVTITNSYAAGSLSADDTIGGLAGQDESDSGSGTASTITDAYWDEETTTTDEYAGVNHHYPYSPDSDDPADSFPYNRTTAEMTGEDAEENMDLDFEDIWMTTDSYPELRDVGPDN